VQEDPQGGDEEGFFLFKFFEKGPGRGGGFLDPSFQDPPCDLEVTLEGKDPTEKETIVSTVLLAPENTEGARGGEEPVLMPLEERDLQGEPLEDLPCRGGG